MTLSEQKKGISWPEAIFFLVYFFVFPIVSAIQYRTNYNDRTEFNTTFIYFGVSSIFTMLAYWIYYKIIIHRLLFTKKYLWFILAVFIWLVLFDFYIRFVIDLSVSKMSFLSDEVQKLAANAYNRSRGVIRQSLSYTFTNLLSVTALAFFMRTLQKEREVKYLQQQQLQLELNALKAQLHPHFFFNTLNNIYSLALEQSTTTAPVVKRLADMMRYMLYETNGDKVQLQQEIDFISNYVELEKIRHDNSKRISFDFQGNTSAITIDPFLLLPFIENAFKHGLEDEIGDGYVEIAIMVENLNIILQVRNSLPSAPGNKGINKSGIGLMNVEKRLALLYPGKHCLQVTAIPEMYQIFLTLTLS